jgi:hypothetical protein
MLVLENKWGRKWSNVLLRTGGNNNTFCKTSHATQQNIHVQFCKNEAKQPEDKQVTCQTKTNSLSIIRQFYINFPIEQNISASFNNGITLRTKNMLRNKA